MGRQSIHGELSQRVGDGADFHRTCKNPHCLPSQLSLASGLVVDYHHVSNVRDADDAQVPNDVRHGPNTSCMPFDAHVSPQPCGCAGPICEDNDCELFTAGVPCTDECVVIPCTDPTHIEDGSFDFCSENCFDLDCEFPPCTGGPDCTVLGFEEFLQCCTDYHSYINDTPPEPTASSADFQNSLDLLLTSPSPHSPIMSNNPPNSRQQQSQQFPVAGGGQLPLSYYQQLRAPPAPHHMPDPRFAPYGGQPFVVPPADNAFAMNNSGVPSQLAPSQTYDCHWDGCGAAFASMSELVGHVNLYHLRTPEPTQTMFGGPQGMQTLQQQQLPPMSCLWDHCQMFPDMSLMPSSSTGFNSSAVLNQLATHLMQDHLGLPSPTPRSATIQSPQPQRRLAGRIAPPLQFEQSASSTGTSTSEDSTPDMNNLPTPTPTSSSCASPAPLHEQPGGHENCGLSHICGWRNCGQTFGTCAELTDHITAVHVGSGQSQYQCFWEGCNRNGEHGFSSKQKILRHLQSHTGHRPFLCEICQQSFSEAATLQQHMRRHTQQKPYVCDYPGCGKAFAITGALTIHKRTHNGERPFKCPHCDRAFAESSNLSKHLRTHTGDRPYVCREPGCNKAFARPDQLSRHANVHLKKRNAAAE